MNLTMALSERMARKTVEWNPSEARTHDALVYQYAVTLNLVSILGLSALTGIVIGKLPEVMTAAAGFMILRMFSGGFHFRSLDVCTLVTAAIFTVIPIIPISGEYVTGVTAAAFAIMAIKGPTNLRNPKVKRVFRAVACVIVAANFFVGSAVLAAAFLVQALLLFPRKGVNSR